MGALDRAGLSVRDLASQKQVDLRETFSCWLSAPVASGLNFRHVLCIETGWRHGRSINRAAITDDLFRALAPFLLTDFPNISVAMPLIGTGDHGWPPGEMLSIIVETAVAWIERGLPLKLLKIVVYGDSDAHDAAETFSAVKRQHTAASQPTVQKGTSLRPPSASYDVFISYAHEDTDMASYVARELYALAPEARIFYDQTSLKEGTHWLLEVANTLDSSRRVLALYSPSYWSSTICQLEFCAAYARQNDTREDVLFPIYLSDAQIPYMFKLHQYSDCRVNDETKLATACAKIAAAI